MSILVNLLIAVLIIGALSLIGTYMFDKIKRVK